MCASERVIRAMLAYVMEDAHPCNCPIADVCNRNRGPFREVQRPMHKILYVEGESAEHVYLIRRGTVSLHHASTEDRALGRTNALRHDGALLGMEALVSPIYQTSARAETPLKLCMATRERVADWVAERQGAGRALLETVLRSRAADVLPQASPDGTATQRVAHWLLQRQQTAAPRNLPRKVMADMLGMRPETLSRALHALADRGFIEVSRNDVLLVDPGGLRNTLPS